MSIENNYIGAWKILVINGQPYIVEDSKESASQDIQAMKYVQGSVMPRVLKISGSTGEVSVTSPLLVYDIARTSEIAINDGLRLWYDLFEVSGWLTPTYYADPGFIISNAKFSLSADQGAKYTITMKGDASALSSENPEESVFWKLLGGNDPDWETSDPFDGQEVPFRVASFYDIIGSIGDPPITGLMEQLDINIDFTTDGFNWIGQANQNKVWGVSSASIKFSGTMISENRAPTKGDFAWQALLGEPDSNGGAGGWGGITSAVPGGLVLNLRDGTDPDPTHITEVNLLPGIDLSEVEVVFDNSSVNINPGFLKSSFSGQAWITTRYFPGTGG